MIARYSVFKNKYANLIKFTFLNIMVPWDEKGFLIWRFWFRFIKKKIDIKYQFLSKAINTKINEIRIRKLEYVIFNLNHAVTYIGLNGEGGGGEVEFILWILEKN